MRPRSAPTSPSQPLGAGRRDDVAVAAHRERLPREPVAIAGLALLALVVAAAIFAPLISPQNPYDLAQIDIMDSKLPPGSRRPTGGTFWLGTDDQGRDMLSAIFYGLRISLAVGVISTVLALAIGLAVGLAAAYFGGRIETLIMRVVDIQLSFPSILIALILIAVLGQGIGKVITALVTVQWAYYARTVRVSGAGREAQGIHRGRALPRAVAGAHRVSPSAAELPAAADRRRDGAGGARRSRSRRRCRSSASACRSPSRRWDC